MHVDLVYISWTTILPFKVQCKEIAAAGDVGTSCSIAAAHATAMGLQVHLICHRCV